MIKKTGSKKPKNIEQPDVLSTNRTWSDFMHPDSYSNFPGKDEWRKRLIYTMYKWAEQSTSLEIMQFCMEYKIPRQTLYDWTHLHPDIKKALDNVRLMIASHRRVGAMRKKLDGAYAYRDMHMLDPEFDAVNKYHAGLKKEEDTQVKVICVDTSKPKVIEKNEQE